MSAPLQRVARRLAGFLLAFVFAGSAAAEPVVHAPTGIAFPDEVAGFQRKEATDYESQQPGLGWSYHYDTDKGVTATVYLYTAGVKVPDDIADPLFMQVREQTLREIAQFSQSRGEVARPSISTTLKVAGPNGQVLVPFDSFVVSAPTGARNTYLVLWPAKGHFMKIRLTRASRGELDPKQMFAFYEALVRLSLQ